MALLKQIESAFKKPASKWHRFLRDVSIDLFLIVLSLWFAFYLSNGQVLSGGSLAAIVQGAVLGLLAVGLLFWRGLYSINVRYIGLSDFLNIVLVGSLVGGALIVLPRV